MTRFATHLPNWQVLSISTRLFSTYHPTQGLRTLRRHRKPASILAYGKNADATKLSPEGIIARIPCWTPLRAPACMFAIPARVRGMLPVVIDSVEPAAVVFVRIAKLCGRGNCQEANLYFIAWAFAHHYVVAV